MKRLALRCAGLLLLLISAETAFAAEVTVTANVALSGKTNSAKKNKETDAGNVALWLTPLDSAAPLPPRQNSTPVRLIQKNKSFQPHVLVVSVGSVVQFPNKDPFFHNVFSLFEGKRFDLGLYEAGSTRDVVFDKPGISYIFCNIHAEMSAVVVTVDTPYYGVSDGRGQVTVPNVPAGRYMLRLWYEAATPELLKSMTREVTVSESAPALGLLRLPAGAEPQPHKNMYGRDYPPPMPDTSAYERP
jgi:plastocyanin